VVPLVHTMATGSFGSKGGERDRCATARRCLGDLDAREDRANRGAFGKGGDEGVDHGRSGPGPVEDALDLAATETGIDPGGDGAETHGRLIADGVVADEGMTQRHDVPLAHAFSGEPGGDGVGPGVPRRERQADVAVDKSLAIGMEAGDLAQQRDGVDDPGVVDPLDGIRR